MQSVTGFLRRRLKLKVNEAKSAVARPQERKFVGFSFSNGKEPKRRIAPKALLRCKQRVRELTRRTRGISLQQMTKELATYYEDGRVTSASARRLRCCTGWKNGSGAG